MNKVFTIVIKAKSTLTQFLCNVMIVSATLPGRRAVDGSGGPAQTPPLGRYCHQKDSSCRVSAQGPGSSAGAALPPEAEPGGGGVGRRTLGNPSLRPTHPLASSALGCPWGSRACAILLSVGGGEAAPSGPGSLAQWRSSFLARPLLGPIRAAWGVSKAFRERLQGLKSEGLGSEPAPHPDRKLQTGRGLAHPGWAPESIAPSGQEEALWLVQGSGASARPR